MDLLTSPTPTPQAIAVSFRPSGANALNLFGAALALHERRHQRLPVRLVGSSGGALAAGILAALLNGNVSPERLVRILEQAPLERLLDSRSGNAPPMTAKAQLSTLLRTRKTLFKGEAMSRWIGHVCSEIGLETWGDLRYPPGTTDPFGEGGQWRIGVVLSALRIPNRLATRMTWDPARDVLGERRDDSRIGEHARSTRTDDRYTPRITRIMWPDDLAIIRPDLSESIDELSVYPSLAAGCQAFPGFSFSYVHDPRDDSVWLLTDGATFDLRAPDVRRAATRDFWMPPLPVLGIGPDRVPYSEDDHLQLTHRIQQAVAAYRQPEIQTMRVQPNPHGTNGYMKLATPNDRRREIERGRKDMHRALDELSESTEYDVTLRMFSAMSELPRWAMPDLDSSPVPHRFDQWQARVAADHLAEFANRMADYEWASAVGRAAGLARHASGRSSGIADDAIGGLLDTLRARAGGKPLEQAVIAALRHDASVPQEVHPEIPPQTRAM